MTSKLHTDYTCPFIQCGCKFKNNTIYKHHLTFYLQRSKFCKCNKIFSNSDSYDKHFTSFQHKQRTFQEIFFFENQVLTFNKMEIFCNNSVDIATDSDIIPLDEGDSSFLVKILQTIYKHLKLFQSHEVVTYLHMQKSLHHPYSNIHNFFWPRDKYKSKWQQSSFNIWIKTVIWI